MYNKVVDTIGQTLSREYAGKFHSTHYEKLSMNASEEELEEDEVVFIRGEMQANGNLYEEPLMGRKAGKKVRIDEEHLGGDFREETDKVHVRKLKNLMSKKLSIAVIVVIIIILLGGGLYSLFTPSLYHPTTPEWNLKVPGTATISYIKFLSNTYLSPMITFISTIRLKTESHFNVVEGAAGGLLLDIRLNLSNVNVVLCGVDLDLDSYSDCIVGDGMEHLMAVCPRDGKIIWHSFNSFKNHSLISLHKINDFNMDGISDLIIVLTYIQETYNATKIYLMSGKDGKIVGSPLEVSEYLSIQFKVIFYKMKDSSLNIIATAQSRIMTGVLLAIKVDNLLAKIENENLKFEKFKEGQWASATSYSKDNIFFNLFSSNDTFVFSPLISDMNKDGVDDIILILTNRISVIDGFNLKLLWTFKFTEYSAKGPAILANYNDDNVNDVILILHSIFENNLQSRLVIIDGLLGSQLYALNLYTPFSQTLYAVRVESTPHHDLIIVQNYSKPTISDNCKKIDSRPRRAPYAARRPPYGRPLPPPSYSSNDDLPSPDEYAMDYYQPQNVPLLNRRRTDPPDYPPLQIESESSLYFPTTTKKDTSSTLNSKCLQVEYFPKELVFIHKCAIQRLSLPNRTALMGDMDMDGFLDALILSEVADGHTILSKFNLQINFLAYVRMLNQTCGYGGRWQLIGQDD